MRIPRVPARLADATDEDRRLAAELLITHGKTADVVTVIGRLRDDSDEAFARAARIAALIRGASLLVVLPTQDNPEATPEKATFCPICAEPYTHCEGHGRTR